MVTITSGIDATQAGVRAGLRRAAGAVLGRGLLPVLLRPVGGAGRAARDERVRAVRALHAGRRAAGRRDAPRSARPRWPRWPGSPPTSLDCIAEREVLGPPDVEARIGLTGGHIFQGDCLPDQMWDRRFAPRTPVPGLYLCGAATHPGGSVIGVNGRNAAMAVLADTDGPGARLPEPT